MKFVFNYFMTNRDDRALLRCLYLLLISTIQSMRSQLRNSYYKLVEKYKRDGWEICDDTSDMDKALILSNVYYGDPYSPVSISSERGKISIEKKRIISFRRTY